MKRERAKAHRRRRTTSTHHVLGLCEYAANAFSVCESMHLRVYPFQSKTHTNAAAFCRISKSNRRRLCQERLNCLSEYGSKVFSDFGRQFKFCVGSALLWKVFMRMIQSLHKTINNIIIHRTIQSWCIKSLNLQNFHMMPKLCEVLCEHYFPIHLQVSKFFILLSFQLIDNF
jgi:hypothetical protein